MSESSLFSSAGLLGSLHACVQDDLQAVERLIQKSLQSSVSLISTIGQHLARTSGKRLRPLLVLLSAKALGYQGDDHIALATVIELLHTATLLHDDVVDSASLRRGQPTANHKWGDHASVLMGDYLYSRAFQLMVDLHRMPVMAMLAKASNQMAEGEMLQLMHLHNPAVSKQDYLHVIRCKTGALFSAAAQMGALLTHQPENMQTSISDFGTHLGMAFQLIDDLLDYTALSHQTGKNRGRDLQEGKPTLPFIYALEYFKMHPSSDHDGFAQVLCEALRGKLPPENTEKLIESVLLTDAASKTYQEAQQQAHQAAQCLQALQPFSAPFYYEKLKDFIAFALERDH